jgi:hypothetical protein
MKTYHAPLLVVSGRLASLTAADFTTAATDSYIGPDGSDLNADLGLGLTGSGDGCVDSNNDGVCDYLNVRMT